MKLLNRFKDIDKQRVWLDTPYCVLCGSNNMCSLHHIKSTESDSILNSSMLCHEHHKYADGHNQSDTEFISSLLQITIKIALRSGYELTKKDIEFYQQHKHLYELN
jgi:hypothetical protein